MGRIAAALALLLASGIAEPAAAALLQVDWAASATGVVQTGLAFADLSGSFGVYDADLGSLPVDVVLPGSLTASLDGSSHIVSPTESALVGGSAAAAFRFTSATTGELVTGALGGESVTGSEGCDVQGLGASTFSLVLDEATDELIVSADNGFFGVTLSGPITYTLIPVPEPATAGLLGAGLLALAAGRRRR